jgi:hypothetical protein
MLGDPPVSPPRTGDAEDDEDDEEPHMTVERPEEIAVDAPPRETRRTAPLRLLEDEHVHVTAPGMLKLTDLDVKKTLG